MANRLFTLLIATPLLAMAFACGDGSSGKEQAAAVPHEVARNQQESLEVLSDQADQLAQQVDSIRVLSANLETLAAQIEELQLAVAEHRKLTEEALATSGNGTTSPGWLTEALILVIVAATLLAVFLGIRLLVKDYDRGELPAEAYTPGMTTDAPPIEGETPTSDDAAPEEPKEQES